MLASTLMPGNVRRYKYLDALTTACALKVGYEVLAMPLTYLVIHWLKSSEGADAVERHVNFNPFSFAMTVTRQIEPTDS